VTTSYDMATPHTPIAILLSHLQPLYNVIIFPGGVRTLLRLVREVGEGVENVDGREGVG